MTWTRPSAPVDRALLAASSSRPRAVVVAPSAADTYFGRRSATELLVLDALLAAVGAGVALGAASAGISSLLFALLPAFAALGASAQAALRVPGVLTGRDLDPRVLPARHPCLEDARTLARVGVLLGAGFGTLSLAWTAWAL